MTKKDSKYKIPPRETLIKLYSDEKKSANEISTILGVSKDTVLKWLRTCDIPRRSVSEASYVSQNKNNGNGLLTFEDMLDIMDDKVEPVKYKYKPKENISIPLPLSVLESDKRKDITLTLSISDLHLAHEAHLPDTYWSTIENLERILNVLKAKFSIKKFNIVWNGDIISGTNVYRFQEFQNLVPKGHWQVFLAERILKKTIDRLSEITPVNNNFLIKGTHEEKTENYMLYIRKALADKATYCSKSLTLNIAEPIGEYNMLFTHGFGSNGFFPISLNLIRELWKTVSDYKLNNIIVERVAVGHSHWLTNELDMDAFKVHVTGGFQKWEYSISQRPAGCILFMYCDGECSVIPIRPNENIEIAEKKDPKLEYKNMKYYAEILEEHMELYETHRS